MLSSRFIHGLEEAHGRRLTELRRFHNKLISGGMGHKLLPSLRGKERKRFERFTKPSGYKGEKSLKLIKAMKEWAKEWDENPGKYSVEALEERTKALIDDTDNIIDLDTRDIIDWETRDIEQSIHQFEYNKRDPNPLYRWSPNSLQTPRGRTALMYAILFGLGGVVTQILDSISVASKVKVFIDENESVTGTVINVNQKETKRTYDILVRPKDGKPEYIIRDVPDGRADDGGNDQRITYNHPRANINLKDTIGWTALMYAVRQHDFKSVKKLIDKGADRTIQNKDGNTALDLAVESNMGYIVSELADGETKEAIQAALAKATDDNIRVFLQKKGAILRKSVSARDVIQTAPHRIDLDAEEKRKFERSWNWQDPPVELIR